ncbi:MAG: hypothetical protein JWR38_5297 [Mucilaginibacter sp.]|nr:hypothetical protein [Mucilaginibacter sp.]
MPLLVRLIAFIIVHLFTVSRKNCASGLYNFEKIKQLRLLMASIDRGLIIDKKLT